MKQVQVVERDEDRDCSVVRELRAEDIPADLAADVLGLWCVRGNPDIDDLRLAASGGYMDPATRSRLEEAARRVREAVSHA
jgi:hypothetical protein